MIRAEQCELWVTAFGTVNRKGKIDPQISQATAIALG